MTIFSSGVLAVAPDWAKGGISEWMLGTPQPMVGDYVYDDGRMSFGEINVSTLNFNGYSGPTGFLCEPLMPEISVYETDFYHSVRTVGSNTYLHPGIDFGSAYAEGREVVTPMSGKVVATKIYGAWGYTLAIENDGYQVLLTHSSEMLVEEGDIVTAGQVVMLSGGDKNGPNPQYAGSSSGPHLHFEERKCDTDEETGNTSCVAIDPSTTLLPGQSTTCDWGNLVNSGASAP